MDAEKFLKKLFSICEKHFKRPDKESVVGCAGYDCPLFIYKGAFCNVWKERQNPPNLPSFVDTVKEYKFHSGVDTNEDMLTFVCRDSASALRYLDKRLPDSLREPLDDWLESEYDWDEYY